MPSKPKKPCSHQGCRKLVEGRYCEEHQREQHKQYDKKFRDKEKKSMYNYRWQKARKVYLADNPLCVHCKEQGKLTEATEIDHIIPHDGDEELFWDESNWQSLCKPCHSKKTAKENGWRE